MNDRNMHRPQEREPFEPITAEQLAAGRAIRRPLSAVPQGGQPAPREASPPQPTPPVQPAPPAAAQPPQTTAESAPPVQQWTPPPALQGPPQPAPQAPPAQPAQRPAPPAQERPAPPAAAPAPFQSEQPSSSQFEQLMAAGQASAPPSGLRPVEEGHIALPPSVQVQGPHDPATQEAVSILAGWMPTERQMLLGQLIRFAREHGVSVRDCYTVLRDVFSG